VSSQNRKLFGARLHPVCAAMLAAEAAVRNTSQGRLLDELVLANCQSPEALEALLDFAATDPVAQAVRAAKEGATT
jgi:hypothetical protein